ncbi:hypothetical protein HN011_000405 [Eciton burchellii]|nr:hypothetical protein HN011_000405 [Eciton burchellii]
MEGLCRNKVYAADENRPNKLARQEAFKDFSHFDDAAIPIDLCKPIRLTQLSPSSVIIIIGYIPKYASRFSVNLCCKTPDNIALHLNPRLDRGYIVRNTKSDGKWKIEETCSLAGSSECILRRNVYVHFLIFCTENAFQIAINGEHFCAFSYRLPLKDITDLLVDGTIEDVRIRQHGLLVYPDPSSCRLSRTLVLKKDKPLLNFLDVPITVNLTNKFDIGTRLFIHGRLKLLPHSFHVNLQKGTIIYPYPTVPLHLNLCLNGSLPCIIMNCYDNGAWNHEERHHLSWMPGRDFLLAIHCEYQGYTIWRDKKMISEFKHKLQPSIINTIQISGDVVLHQVSMDCI